ncbi:SRPBCC family protein [Thermopolyspora sp. NPDC052614]|uniref:SRPBCC family protein n=1 Tax=Thermopolyspora sp. NPDC052614 TaxID=3155682 RepID=UPI00342A2F6B
MKLEQEFTIPTEVSRAWEVLLDVSRIAPCFPGATLTSFDGDTVAGAVKVKLGPVLLNYKGTARFTERDDAAHRVVIDAAGTDVKGNGTARAQVTAALHESAPGRTTCTLVTDLAITGRPAQFGRGMIAEIGNKILDRFAANLAANLADSLASSLSAADAPAPVAAAAPTPGQTAETPQTPDPAPDGPRRLDGAPASASPASEAEALDLLALARGSVAKRAIPLVAALAVLIGVIIWWAGR